MKNHRRRFLKTTLSGIAGMGMTGTGFDLTPLANLGASTISDASGASGVSGGDGMPKRFIFIRKSNGQRPNEMKLPSLSGALAAKEKNKEAFEVGLDGHELPVCMRELESYKSRLTILQGLSARMSENGHSSLQSVMGLFKFKRGGLKAITRATIDFELAKLFPSPVGHVELSFAQNRRGIVPGFSAPAPRQINYCFADPVTAYNNLFKAVLNPTAMDSDNDMLQYLASLEARKAGGFQESDKRHYENHVKSIERLKAKNKTLVRMSDEIARFMPDAKKIKAYGEVASTTPQKMEAMSEVLVAALASGMTNVVTYTIDDLRTTHTGVPGNENDVVDLHKIGHNKAYSGVSAGKVRESIRTLHAREIKRIADQLSAIPEGPSGGNMFDNTMIMYFPEGGETHHGHGYEAPFVILSGKNCNVDLAGRYIRLPYLGTKGHQTLGNWYTTLLNVHGNPIEHYGDMCPVMMVKKLPQEGAIKQFLRTA